MNTPGTDLVETAPQPDIPPPAPLLTEGLVDEALLLRLVADLESCAEILEILAKSGPSTMSESGSRLGMREAFHLLTQRRLRALQVRYRYQGEEWWDSILALPVGFRVVRIRQQDH
ncbi:MAG: hypothetical protein IT580_20080 [Verrucomicrobiales bacterium]|nr:hypothetical protein [Verrucomicrobiales bacterium]